MERPILKCYCIAYSRIMPRQRKSVAIHREKISVSIPEDLLVWLESRTKDHTFANISNGIVLCILEGQKKYGK